MNNKTISFRLSPIVTLVALCLLALIIESIGLEGVLLVVATLVGYQLIRKYELKVKQPQSSDPMYNVYNFRKDKP